MYYLSIVPHAIGIGEDGAEVPKTALLSASGPLVKGGAPPKMPVIAVLGVRFTGFKNNGFLRHGKDKDEGM
jgi:hypothetical protein